MTREAGGARVRRPPAERRAEILRTAMETFAERGYQSASLAEIADRVGLTQAGVLHYFSSKAGLLTGVLDLRDSTDIEELGSERPRGLAFLRHLVETTRRNAGREGIVRLYTVLAAESVTAEHPAQRWFRDRYQGLLALVAEALDDARALGEVAADVDSGTTSRVIVATMDGLQLQWLLEPGSVDMAEATEVAIVRLIGRDLPPAARH
ncbi:TetR/AcrR family transcriptional regulator [Promicromonospora umidemergens]|uniref:TetR/AcrR family transcriptional regulator n=1 Tax=Promicromonospora umidemergens TaxID=629679 RepID=UPI0020A5EDF7|nr:TetR/AcrR family transcriptional regulator [Promicromonospora umidemergens]